MSDNFGPTFGGYTDITEVVTAALNTELTAEIAKLTALIPDITADPPVQAAHPDFDQIHPRLADQLRAEIAALQAAIDAAPTV